MKLQNTVYRIEIMEDLSAYPNIMSSVGRRSIRLFAFIASAFVALAFVLNDELSVLWVPLLVLPGLISIIFYTMPKRLYYAPIIFTLFYFVGYLLDFSVMLIDKAPVAFLFPAEQLRFSNIEFAPAVLIISNAMTALACATLFAEKMAKCRLTTNTGKIRQTLLPLTTSRMNALVWAWIATSVMLSILLWLLGIGRTGLQHETALPFKLAGLLSFTRGYFLPFVGIVFLELCIRAWQKRLTLLLINAIIGIGLLGSIACTSRSFFVFTVFPAILFIYFSSKIRDWQFRVMKRYLIIAVALMFLVIFSVNNIRAVSFDAGGISICESLGVLKGVSLQDILSEMSRFASFALARIGGMRELLAGLKSSVSDPYAPWAVFIGDTDYITDLLSAVFNYSPVVSDTLAFGIAIGFWNQFALSGSQIIIFLGIFFSCLLAISVETLFMRIGLRSGALFYACAFVIQIWNNISWFVMNRLIFMAIISYLFIKFLGKSCHGQACANINDVRHEIVNIT